MIVNPEKFQAIIFKKSQNDTSSFTLNFDGKQIETSSSVILLGIEIDDILIFKKHIDQIVKRAAGY